MTIDPDSPTTTRRRPRPPQVLLIAVVVGISMLGCGPDIPPPTPEVASPPATNHEVSSPVDGIVIAVDSAGLSDVRGFTLRTTGGLVLTFVLGLLENATEFSPSHLAEHQASSEPVRVYFRTEGGGRVVYRLADAAEPGAT